MKLQSTHRTASECLYQVNQSALVWPSVQFHSFTICFQNGKWFHTWGDIKLKCLACWH